MSPVHIPLREVEVGSLLGRGAFGAVFRGRWSGREVAVKVLNLQSGVEAGDLRESFQRELQLLVACNHPHIVRRASGLGPALSLSLCRYLLSRQ